MLDFSLRAMSLSGIGALFLIVSAIVYLIRRCLLFKPIPGIPYNKAAAHSILGDIPEMISYMNATGEVFEWMTSQIERHNSPIVQVFARPFSKPWVFISDFQESQDILMRRTKEFDRSAFFGDIFLGVFPDHHISKKSKDPHFKSNRALLKDLMTPAFLHDVCPWSTSSIIMGFHC